MHRKILNSDFFWPLSALTVVTIGAFVGIGFAVVSRLDHDEKVREQAIVSNGWNIQLSDAAKRVVPQVVWDGAVLNLDNHHNRAWARDNVGAYLRDVGGFKWTRVLDASDNAWFRSGHGKGEELRSFEAIAPNIALLVKETRMAEAARGPLARNAEGRVVAAPLQRSTIVVRDGGLELVTATLVQPDFGKAMPRMARSAIVLTGLALDEAFLAEFASRFMLEGLHEHVGASDFETAEAHLPLKDASGAVIQTIDWAPKRPGSLVLEKAAAPALFILITLAGAMIFLYRRSRRAAQGLIASEARASHLAHHDALTGLPNRLLFCERLAHALGEVRGPETAVAVFCIDLDRFKDVNDIYGHPGGDELIALAARRMREMCRETDLVARLSGDEFLIMYRGATPETATGCAKRLCAGLAEPFMLGAGNVFVGGTVGVLLVTERGLETAEALRRADLALYRAKEMSKGGYCFFELEMDQAQQMRRVLEADLRDAIKNEKLDMAYQPQVNSRGHMVGVEALVRWRHPERGDISPGYFVPIAEECGLIHELGMLTLRRAFKDSRRWDKLKVAVNVSATQLRMTGFVDDLAALVREMNVDAARFELEITEGILLGDDAQIQETLQGLRALGFSLALDDFGTGYSSLSYLRRFPISKIKIDRSFVTTLGVDAESDAVVAAIVRLARALHLSVIAEGVETNEQRERLAAAGCVEVQGFLYGRPVGADTIDQMRALRGATLEQAA